MKYINFIKLSAIFLSGSLIFAFNNSVGNFNFQYSDLNDYECINGKCDTIVSEYFIITKISTDCSLCLSELREWNNLLDQIDMFPLISFIAVSYGHHKIRFKYVISQEFNDFDYPIYYTDSISFNEDLIIVNKENHMIKLNSPFANQKSKMKFLSVINNICSETN